jgi:hypothetical protein
MATIAAHESSVREDSHALIRFTSFSLSGALQNDDNVQLATRDISS